MPDQVNGGLLRVARQRQGLQQGVAALRLGIPQVTLSRYENGVSLMPAEITVRAAALYRLPISFFYQPDQILGAPVSVHPMWRKRQDVTTREMDAIIAELNIRVMHIRRMIDAVEYTPQSTIPRLDPEEYGNDVEKIAAVVRAHWLPPNGPIADLTASIERAGAIVIHSPLSGSTVSGITISVPGLLPIIRRPAWEVLRFECRPGRHRDAAKNCALLTLIPSLSRGGPGDLRPSLRR
jgi:transcriptional regulator with XRE-family HTH domain